MSCESYWSILKISSVFSNHVNFKNSKDVFVSFIRRSLLYPLNRNFELSFKVISDLKMVLMIGKNFILKVLLNLRDEFIKN